MVEDNGGMNDGREYCLIVCRQYARVNVLCVRVAFYFVFAPAERQ